MADNWNSLNLRQPAGCTIQELNALARQNQLALPTIDEEKLYTYSAEEKFQPEEIDQFKEIFSYFDHKGDGTMPIQRLALRATGMVATNQDIALLSKKYATKEATIIDLEGFINCVAELSNFTDSSPDSIKNAFYLFDKNDNGLVQISEFKHVLSAIGDAITEDEMNAIVAALDINNDSYLRMSDIINLLHVSSPQAQQK